MFFPPLSTQKLKSLLPLPSKHSTESCISAKNHNEWKFGLIKLISNIRFCQYKPIKDDDERQEIYYGIDINSLYGGDFLFEDMSFSTGLTNCFFTESPLIKLNDFPSPVQPSTA